jgi:AcrR family transcriptional regulator
VTISKSKARIPVQKRSIETKEKILNAAWTLFAEKGYFKTSTHDMAEQAGIATGSFYGYFNNKKEVAIEIIRRFYKEASEKALYNFRLQIGDTVSENLETCRKLIRFIIQSLKESHAINPMLHREGMALILLDEDVRKINHEEEQKVVALIVAFLRQYKQFIRVDDIEAAAIMLFRTCDEIIHRIMINKEEIEAERLLKELEDMICNYLFIPFGDKNRV